ncbi:PVC-type heme-binding CxxCH protein [Candidatus Laterigemmans baculatus]|uniref:PVC-type heme-binding CxxCH protein n=1 Tax=Candidatus Laterigemmans baculatus TaxID=2770505 RepID=UPI0013DB11F6|nr:PVC-type heme-binding CxxCH protein [Candidatus Laterigemmans baculatus]
MNRNYWLSLAVSVGLLPFNAWAGDDGPASEPVPPTIAEASEEGAQAIAGFRIPEGWQIQLYAAEPDVANIVAFDIDNLGRMFVCETFRQNQGVTDNRGHDEKWLKADLAAQTVQDRIDYHRELLGDAAAEYTKQDDRIRLVEDTDHDGVADSSRVYASGFNQLEDGTGAGVLARGKNVYYTNIPKLYNLIDSDADGVADERVVMSDGYGVRVAFRGHDLHGLVLGPDGRLYFSIGDRGYHVVSKEGDVLHNPAVGAVFRCELDGSDLEVFAVGLRNPQELAFNDYGDLFTGDNNSDSGDRARIVYVVQDGDSGWRMYYQYLPDRGPFNREKIWHPFHDEQPAYLMPPVANFADGPSGLAYYPGTGFGDSLRDTFLLADFRGSAANSGVRTFRVEAEGAFYTLAEDAQPIWSMLATDVAFGPDGGLYVSDWVDGWNGEGKARVYRLTDPKHAESPEVREVAELLAGDWSGIGVSRLAALLTHTDRRVRLEAQWELARRGEATALARVAGDSALETLPRLHGLWGMEQIARRMERLEEATGELVRRLLVDPDPYVRAAAAQFAGQHASVGGEERLTAMLADESPRVRYFAARALGWLESGEAMPAIVAMLAENDNRDPVLRHGGVMALSSIADAAALAGLAEHGSANVRRAAVVALRRQGAAEVARFLNDGDSRVVVEAARAIHDLPIAPATEALASLLERPLNDEALIRRVLNANFRLGTPEAAAAIARYAGRASAPESMRLEALAMLGEWASPDERDRVLNDWRPLGLRPAEEAQVALQESLASVLAGPESVRTAAVTLAAELGLREITPLLAERLADEELNEASRAAALRALAVLDPKAAAVQATELLGPSAASASTATAVRVAALETLADTAPAESLDLIIASTQSGHDSKEQQAAWDALATISHPAAQQQLTRGVADYLSGSLAKDVELNVIEAARQSGEEELVAKLDAQLAKATTADPLAPWLSSLAGGDAERGETLFFTKTEVSCVRCHKVAGQGGEVGPDLTAIAKDKNRRYLLESIVTPDSQIAKGFETTVIADDLGTVHTGIVRRETEEVVELIRADGSLVRVPTEEIVARRRGQSAMPADLVKYLTPRELRDLVAYLSGLETEAAPKSEGHAVR